MATGTAALNIVSLVNANLVKLSYPSLHVVGDLAGRWAVTDKGRVYTFSLRPNARFSNGDKVTPAAVVWSIRRALLPATRSFDALTDLGHLKGADAFNSGRTTRLPGVMAVGNNSVRMTLDKPVAVFLTALAGPVADILDPRTMTGKPAGAYLTNACTGSVGAGPFEFKCRNSKPTVDSFYARGTEPAINLVANPYYYGPKPRITMHAPIFPTADDVFKAYQSGAVDGAVVPPSDMGAAKSMKGFMRAPELETDYITPNAGIAPFNDIHCRLAVAYAINRKAVNDTVLGGAQGPLYDMLPPGLPGYFGAQPGIPSYDPARARRERELCAGGLHNVRMAVQNTPDVVREYNAIAGDLRAIGADVTIEPISQQKWLGATSQNMSTAGQQQTIIENLWLADYPDASDWCSNQMRSTAPDNVGNFRSARYDRLVDRADIEQNPRERATLYDEAQRIALSGGYWISVGYVNGLYIIPPRIHGLVPANGSVWPVGNDWSRVRIGSTS